MTNQPKHFVAHCRTLNYALQPLHALTTNRYLWGAGGALRYGKGSYLQSDAIKSYFEAIVSRPGVAKTFASDTARPVLYPSIRA